VGEDRVVSLALYHPALGNEPAAYVLDASFYLRPPLFMCTFIHTFAGRVKLWCVLGYTFCKLKGLGT
jgi:hypothetical protein